MGLKFNPFTGNFDFTGSGGGGGGGGSDVYQQAFTSGDWVLIGQYYYITVLQATHNKGTSPGVQVFEQDGSDYNIVNVDQAKVLSNGNVQIRVPQSPDLRFNGRLVII